LCLLLTDNIGSVFLTVDSLLIFVMCTVTLQRLRDSVTQIYTFIIIIIIIIIIITVNIPESRTIAVLIDFCFTYVTPDTMSAQI